MRVIVQERRALVRAGLVRLLSEDRTIEVVAQVADGAELPALVATHRPGGVVLELQPTGWDLGSVLSWIAANQRRCVVVALHQGRRADHEAKAAQLGVQLVSYRSGVVGIRRGLRGRADPTPVTGTDRRRLPSRNSLTEREREVLARAARGETSETIGEALGLKPRTVELVIQRVIIKLGARGRAHAVSLAHRIGLLGAA